MYIYILKEGVFGRIGPKRRKATSKNGDNERLYLHCLKNVV